MTCVQRNGDETNPVYDIARDDCVSCLEYNSDTPIWNGTACVACASGTAYDISTGLCESIVPRLKEKVGTCEIGYIKISTAEELAKIGVDEYYSLSDNYCLMNDISLAAYGENYNNGKGWTPIGNDTNPFTGIFDGNGQEISDLYMNRGDEYYRYYGLFGSLVGTIRKLGVTGTLEGEYSSYAGILVASNSGTISHSYAKGNISGVSDAGCLIGFNSNIVNNSYAVCDINAKSADAGCVGALVSYNTGGSIENCYAMGSIGVDNSAYSRVGGLAGYNTGTINNSYAAAALSGAFEGGIVGEADDNNISGSIFDISIAQTKNTHCNLGNGRTWISCATSSTGITGLTTAEMQTPQTFIDAGWDTTIWELVQGQYPKLKNVGGQ